MHWIAPSEKDTDNAHAGKAPLGRRRPVPRQLRPQGPGILRARPRPHLPALRRSPLRRPARQAGEGRRVRPAAAVARGRTRRLSRRRHPLPARRGAVRLPAQPPEAENIGAKVNAAMRDIEKHNPQLAGVLPKTYNLFTSTLLKELLKKVSEIPASLDYDAFGRIYEYFLGEFATHRRPERRRVLHPEQHRPPPHRSHRALSRAHPRPRVRFGRHVRPVRPLRGRAQEESRRRTLHPRRREDRRNRTPLPPEPRRPRPRRRHPPRRQRQQLLRRPARRHRPLRLRPRQSAVQRQRRGQGAAERLVGPGRRFPFGLPRTDNANYLWIQLFYSALNDKGRAGFVMANSASDARSSEQELRRNSSKAAPWT